MLRRLNVTIASVPRHCRLFSAIKRNETSVEIKALATTFPYVWLRDSCQCRFCVHPSTRQKLHRSSDIPLDIKPAAYNAALQARENPKGLLVSWEGGHSSFYSATFLQRYASWADRSEFHRDVKVVPWSSKELTAIVNDPTSHIFTPYAQLSDPAEMRRVLVSLLKYGLVFVQGVPVEETSSRRCELRVLAQKFGEMRHTFYGKYWDVRNVQDSKNIAYTNLDLGLHMDLLYFQHPPKFQMLHCLRNRVDGGTSIFVDAFQSALELAKAKPSAFAELTSRPVHYHYINDGHHLHCAHPVIELATPGSSRYDPSAELAFDASLIRHINYSPPFQAPLAPETPASFYESLAAFTKAVENPKAKFEYLLQEGDVAIFDNRRVLHARTAFKDKDDPDEVIAEGESNRWLKGCYLQEDALLDRMRMVDQVNDLHDEPETEESGHIQ